MVPYDKRHEIDQRAGDDFVIIASHKHRKTLSRVFVVETSEEEFVFLRLKYGSENVWKR